MRQTPDSIPKHTIITHMPEDDSSRTHHDRFGHVMGENATNPRDQSSAERADSSSGDLYKNKYLKYKKKFLQLKTQHGGEYLKVTDATADDCDNELGALVIDDEDESLSDIFSLNMDSLSKRVSNVHIFVRPGKRHKKNHND